MNVNFIIIYNGRYTSNANQNIFSDLWPNLTDPSFIPADDFHSNLALVYGPIIIIIHGTLVTKGIQQIFHWNSHLGFDPSPEYHSLFYVHETLCSLIKQLWFPDCHSEDPRWDTTWFSKQIWLDRYWVWRTCDFSRPDNLRVYGCLDDDDHSSTTCIQMMVGGVSEKPLHKIYNGDL